MADGTKIEWTEATWNPITGCSVTSPGCTNCYAMKLAGTRLRNHPSRADLTQDSKAGPVWTGEVRLNEQWLDQPLRWRKPRMIFVCAHGDLFHESVPDEWIDRVFAVMALCPQHTFQVLTKRSARMREYMTSGERDPLGRGAVQYIQDAAYRLAGRLAPDWNESAAQDARQAVIDNLLRINARTNSGFKNVWLGVSAEDQARADERIPDLLATPAAVRWLSCEPLLGPVVLDRITFEESHYEDWLRGEAWDDVNGGLNQEIWGNDEGPKIDWVVCGGESGRGARPMHPDWARSLRDQCAAAGVPFFFKQWGEHLLAHERHQHGFPPGAFVDHLDAGAGFIRVGKKSAGRMLDGVMHDGMPEVRT